MGGAGGSPATFGDSLNESPSSVPQSLSRRSLAKADALRIPHSDVPIQLSKSGIRCPLCLDPMLLWGQFGQLKCPHASYQQTKFSATPHSLSNFKSLIRTSTAPKPPRPLSRRSLAEAGWDTRPRVCRPAPSPVGIGREGIPQWYPIPDCYCGWRGADHCTRGRVRSPPFITDSP